MMEFYLFDGGVWSITQQLGHAAAGRLLRYEPPLQMHLVEHRGA